ncbi:MAG: MerR family transcriptional regulator [Dehalococcoidia bacterium]
MVKSTGRESYGTSPASNGGRYAISVASQLAGMHPQTLRKYERQGLIRPARSGGNVRLYSEGDVRRLRAVRYLVEERGLNLSGVEMALEIGRRMREFRRQLATRSRKQLAADIHSFLEWLGQHDDQMDGE